MNSSTLSTGYQSVIDQMNGYLASSYHRHTEVDQMNCNMLSTDDQSEVAQMNDNFLPFNHQSEIDEMDSDNVSSHCQPEVDLEMNLNILHPDRQSEVYQLNSKVTSFDQPIMNLQNASNNAQTVDTSIPKSSRPKFKPMDAVNQAPVLQEQDRETRRLLGFSEAYRGDVHNIKNRQADIPNDENVSLFLTNLPWQYSERELVLALLPHGPFDRIYAVSVTAPGDSHSGSSAKIVLFTRSGAERLYVFINSGKFIVSGRQVTCCWNRIKYAAPGGADYLSRVIVIWVKKTVLDEQKLRKLLDNNLVYQLENVIFAPVKHDTSIARIEVRFCSFRAQAEAFRLLLSSELPEAKVRYGVDPLAVASTSPSFTRTRIDDKKALIGDKWDRLGRFRRGED